MPAPSIGQRIAAEFDARAKRIKAEEQQHQQESQEHEQRLARFEQVAEELRSVLRPRLEEFARQFGDRLKITPSVSPGLREARAQFLTDLANMTLRVSMAPSADATKLVMDYDLLIIPMYFEYERHARIEMPLDKIDRDALGAWLDDRLLSCVRAYLSVQDNEFYLKRAMVEDPVSHARFLPAQAAATLEHAGGTKYFESEATLAQYKQKHQLS